MRSYVLLLSERSRAQQERHSASSAALSVAAFKTSHVEHSKESPNPSARHSAAFGFTVVTVASRSERIIRDAPPSTPIASPEAVLIIFISALMWALVV